MGFNEKPEWASQEDWDAYVTDMEAEPPYEPREEDLALMEADFHASHPEPGGGGLLFDATRSPEGIVPNEMGAEFEKSTQPVVGKEAPVVAQPDIPQVPMMPDRDLSGQMDVGTDLFLSDGPEY